MESIQKLEYRQKKCREAIINDNYIHQAHREIENLVSFSSVSMVFNKGGSFECTPVLSERIKEEIRIIKQCISSQVEAIERAYGFGANPIKY